MTAVLDLMREIAAVGGTLTAVGDRLRVRAPAPLPEGLLARLRQHKPEVLHALTAPQEPCGVCGCGIFWRSSPEAEWHCRDCDEVAGRLPTRLWPGQEWIALPPRRNDDTRRPLSPVTSSQSTLTSNWLRELEESRSG